ncbi:MAG: endonuclease III [Helicobacter trogontum]|uniref:endonuclease III n=1 Tax=Helicobacter trogontum TaxID=50960 RepID=UPI0024303A6A|nr:endonuclease III [Helicobacter trogontum]MCI5787415.1 endonuclease III [Helicobacter trogontum]
MLPHFLQNTEINDGFDLLVILRKHYCVGNRQSWWWPNFLSLRVENGIEIEGATQVQFDLSLCFATILGQNTKYEYAATSLSNLYMFFYDNIAKNPNDDLQLYSTYPNPHLAQIAQPYYQDSILQLLAQLLPQDIMPLIRISGFYQQKATRLITLAQNIIKDFETFHNFSTQVTKEWLLSQKGIGLESASSILNYALKREEMVVDSYTQRLLGHCGLLFDDYYSIQNFLTQNLYKAHDLYGDMPLAQIMARFHGKIVECSKQYKIAKLTY